MLPLHGRSAHILLPGESTIMRQRQMPIYRAIQFLAMFSFMNTSEQSDAGSLTTIDPPGSVNTTVYGISGDNIVGSYHTSNNILTGFVYNGSTYMTIAPPGAIYSEVDAIAGNYMAGVYNNGGVDRGFVYNGASYSTFAVPDGSLPLGVLAVTGVSSAGNVVGNEWVSGHTIGAYEYNGSTVVSINVPGSALTYAQGISGNDVYGFYSDGHGISYGFLFDGTTYTKMIGPPGPGNGAVTSFTTDGKTGVGYSDVVGLGRNFLYDVASQGYTLIPPDNNNSRVTLMSGNIAIGPEGHYWDGSTWSQINLPAGDTLTYVYGIEGNNVIGIYNDAYGLQHGFEYQIDAVPEPSTICLLGFGGVVLVAVACRRRSARNVA